MLKKYIERLLKIYLGTPKTTHIQLDVVDDMGRIERAGQLLASGMLFAALLQVDVHTIVFYLVRHVVRARDQLVRVWVGHCGAEDNNS